MAKHACLVRAKKQKYNEFYTRLEDVSAELNHYKKHLRNKIVLCNCDDPTWSAFWKYFHLNFKVLGLKKLIATHYNKSGSSYKTEYTGGDDNDVESGIVTQLCGNGDFRSQECIDLLKECDIVVTNPPFSLSTEYISCLIQHEKKFLIIFNRNTVACKNVFPLIYNKKIWFGYGFAGGTAYFDVPKDADISQYERGTFSREHPNQLRFRNCIWLTNMDIRKRHENLDLWQEYNKEMFKKYDKVDAINVDKLTNIPKDYNGIMGVPITFLDVYNPDQFEILGLNGINGWNRGGLILNGKKKYTRLFIRRK